MEGGGYDFAGLGWEGSCIPMRRGVRWVAGC